MFGGIRRQRQAAIEAEHDEADGADAERQTDPLKKLAIRNPGFCPDVGRGGPATGSSKTVSNSFRIEGNSEYR
jgi:hypothetical protein